MVFTLTVPTKGTRPDETVQAFFARYPADPALCPVDCFTHYLTLTSEKRVAQQGKPNNLFISYIKPHHPVTKIKQQLLVGFCPLLWRQALTQKFLKLIR